MSLIFNFLQLLIAFLRMLLDFCLQAEDGLNNLLTFMLDPFSTVLQVFN